MKNMRKTPNKQGSDHIGNDIIAILKSSIIAIIMTLVCFAIFAIIIKVADLQETIIAPVVQVIRTLSIAFGGMLAAKSSKKLGWLKGGITGVVYVLLAFMISSMFGGSIFMGSVIFSDILLGVIAGAVGGIIGVNV
ncbi:MAG: TIGR04086 family membrane protein [Clostridiales bacterium]|nr:TIGR04086 family membrane protein [Clostridiales bacterium]